MTNEDAISRLYRRATQAYAAGRGDGEDMASEEAMLDYLAYCTAIDALEQPIDEASYLQGFEDGIAGERALVAHENPPIKEIDSNQKEFDFSNQDILMTERGMNRNIKAHLLPDKEMVGLGFHKQADKWFCFKTLDQKYDISFCVEIDATNDALHISVIDEDFGQHYDYQRVLRDSPDSEVALNIWRKVEEQMKKLTDAGLITGHVYGRYI